MHITLSPHFDDAALSLGGLISMMGRNSTVITICGGSPVPIQNKGWDLACGFNDSDHAIHERRIEDRNGLNALGLTDEQIIHLGFLDGQYRGQESGEQFNGLMKKITAELLQELAKLPAGAHKFYAPLFSGHTDHVLIRLAMLEMMRMDNSMKHEFLLYLDFPYVFNFLQQVFTDNLEDDFKKIDDQVAAVLPGMGFERLISVYGDEVFSKKLAAIDCYPSQVNKLFPGGRTKLLENLSWFSTNLAKTRGANSPHCELVYQIGR